MMKRGFFQITSGIASWTHSAWLAEVGRAARENEPRAGPPIARPRLFLYASGDSLTLLTLVKSAKILFWVTTIIIFLFEGVMPALTSHTDLAKEGIRHLGYPEYFGFMLMGFKVLGSLALIIPAVPARVKEWAYAGFGIDFLAALISILVVDGMTSMAILPLAFIGILVVSYVSYHKLMATNGKAAKA